jgi:hypothetical protein
MHTTVDGRHIGTWYIFVRRKEIRRRGSKNSNKG